ncbi:unnamed protein product [Scytosiphon promiscuus]
MSYELLTEMGKERGKTYNRGIGTCSKFNPSSYVTQRMHVHRLSTLLVGCICTNVRCRCCGSVKRWMCARAINKKGGGVPAVTKNGGIVLGWYYQTAAIFD